MMRYLLLCLMAFLYFSCAEKEEFRMTGTAEDDFITGTFAGRSFHFATQNNMEALTYYQPKRGEPISSSAEIVRLFNPDLLPEFGLFLSRTDREQRDIAYFIVEQGDLHEQAFPYSIPTEATLSWAAFDYSSEGCPHPDLETEITQAVSLRIDGWDERYLRGTFQGVDDISTAGTFQVAFSRPE